MAARPGAVPEAMAAVERLCREPADLRVLRASLIERLRTVVGFDWYVWLLTDPATEVGSSPLAEVPSLPDLPRLIRARYLATVNRWTGLDRAAVSLQGSSGGGTDPGGAWCELLVGYGVVDVSSVVFRDPHGCWGWLDLWRGDGSHPFDEDDLAALTAAVPPITEALRRGAALTFADAGNEVEGAIERGGPAVLVLSDGLEVKAQTAETEAHLRRLLPPDGGQPPVPAGAYNVAAQLLATEAGVDYHPATARVHRHGDRWLTLRAARVEGAVRPGDRDIAVTIEPASSAERLDLFTRSHALTRRERELVEHVARGADTRAIAGAMYLSTHTVQDHLKSIFAKTGCRNRRTLLARLAGP